MEEKEDNPEFLEKLLRSIENNIKDKSMVLARKLINTAKENQQKIKINEKIYKKNMFIN